MQNTDASDKKEAYDWKEISYLMKKMIVIEKLVDNFIRNDEGIKEYTKRLETLTLFSVDYKNGSFCYNSFNLYKSAYAMLKSKIRFCFESKFDSDFKSSKKIPEEVVILFKSDISSNLDEDDVNKFDAATWNSNIYRCYEKYIRNSFAMVILDALSNRPNGCRDV